MLNRCLSILPFVVLLGLGTIALPDQGQALVPHMVQLDPVKLERQGLGLAQEAAQLAQFQQYELAVPRAELATQLAPKSFQVWALLGELYRLTNQVDSAITALTQAQTLDRNNAPIQFSLGSAYFQKGNYTKAAEYLKAGLRIKPNVPGAMFDLGNAYLMLRQDSEAIAQYEKAIAQDKDFWPAINNIGLIKYEKGDVDEALRRWRKAVTIDAKAAEPQLAIAVALYTKGDREQGLTAGEAAITLDSRYSDLKFLKENLWGDRLLKDTKLFLETPRMKAIIVQAGKNRSSQR